MLNALSEGISVRSAGADSFRLLFLPANRIARSHKKQKGAMEYGQGVLSSEKGCHNKKGTITQTMDLPLTLPASLLPTDIFPLNFSRGHHNQAHNRAKTYWGR